MRLCHKRPPEEQRGAQRSQQEVEDYYNVSPGTAPSHDETELLHVLKETSASGGDTQAVGSHLHSNRVQEEATDL